MESAVRATRLPTGIQASAAEERSQHRESAARISGRRRMNRECSTVRAVATIGFHVLAALTCLSGALAQDPFEIHIYEYEPLSWREFSLEAHLNVMGQGTSLNNGSLLPTSHQTHLTLEPTFGVSENFAIGFMFLNAWEPGYTPQFAGWRVLPHFYAPETWHLPFRLGFVSEFSFQNISYEENSRRVELRPILDREFSRWQIVLNPVFERALHGPWNAARLECGAGSV
jgi:hypothetical protein